MLERMMRYCKNYFVVNQHYGTYEIKSGKVDLPFLMNGQYYLIEGSIFNDGVHRRSEEILEDETFTGYVYALAVPKAFIELSEEIKAWCDKYADAMDSPYASESFGGYTYSKASGTDTADAWKKQFGSRLNAWRKV